jgi:hypothetical protein
MIVYDGAFVVEAVRGAIVAVPTGRSQPLGASACGG